MRILNNNEEFEGIIKEGNVLVDFYAEWCGPCKMLTPVLESLTEVEVLKVNIDTFPELTKEFGVMSVPTLIYFENGLEKEKLIGFRSKEEILRTINK